MARPLRLEFPGAVYHVTSRGNARQDIVGDDRDRAQFLALLAHVVDRYEWLCHAYCLMDNHCHLLTETLQPTLSRGMRQLIGRYTQSYTIGTSGSDIFSRYGSWRFWSERRRTCWSFAAALC